MPGQRAPEQERREQIVSAAYAVALRTGIAEVTLRAVAAQAGLSHGLLLFHFKRKDEIIGALLDRVLATTAMLHLSEEALSKSVARLPRAPDRLGALLRHELERLSVDPRGMRLFFEYWALGVRHTAIRQKIASALERYRAAFRSVAAEVVAAGGPRPTAASSGAVTSDALTPDALAAVAVSLINGCAVQMMIDPERFDTAAYLAAVQGLVGTLAPAAPARVRKRTNSRGPATR